MGDVNVFSADFERSAHAVTLEALSYVERTPVSHLNTDSTPIPARLSAE